MGDTDVSMSHHLTLTEALTVSDALLTSLYTADVYRRWSELKRRLGFPTEREFVVWLLDCAEYQPGEGLGVDDDKVEGEADLAYPADRRYSHNTDVVSGQEQANLSDSVLVPSVELPHHQDLLHTHATHPHQHHHHHPPPPQNTDMKHACDSCPKRFTSRHRLTRHVQTVHLRVRERKFVCVRCPRAFTDAYLLARHERDVHTPGEEGRRYACQHCGKKFKRGEHVLQHVRSVHLKMGKGGGAHSKDLVLRAMQALGDTHTTTSPSSGGATVTHTTDSQHTLLM